MYSSNFFTQSTVISAVTALPGEIIDKMHHLYECCF